jgi:histidyl-tRNA synthetase
MIQPRTPSGTMELLPRHQIAFQRMLDTIRRGYERFGFLPIETPVFEVADVLLTKSGGETEKQVYFVQSTGSREQGYAPDLALRFDLTVPLARYVAEHERDLAFPFRRYQMQRVYRGERPQKGREREFYQCDIDVIGKDTLSPLYDAELPAVIVGIFEEMQIGDFTVNFNNRKVLLGLLESLGAEDANRQTLAMREIDKLDKIGAGAVIENLQKDPINLEKTKAETLLSLLTAGGSNADQLARLQALPQTAQLTEGLVELRQVIDGLKAQGVPESRARLNLSIARGLDYYTGTVYETFLTGHERFGSICSGGRYENLAGHYTKSKLPGVGLSIGATRLFAYLLDAGLVQDAGSTIDALICQLDPALQDTYFALGAELRAAGIRTDMALDGGKMAKQMKYADRIGARFVLLVGGDEVANQTVTVKDMVSGDQTSVARAEAPSFLTAALAALSDKA